MKLEKPRRHRPPQPPLPEPHPVAAPARAGPRRARVGPGNYCRMGRVNRHRHAEFVHFGNGQHVDRQIGQLEPLAQNNRRSGAASRAFEIIFAQSHGARNWAFCSGSRRTRHGFAAATTKSVCRTRKAGN